MSGGAAKALLNPPAPPPSGPGGSLTTVGSPLLPPSAAALLLAGAAGTPARTPAGGARGGGGAGGGGAGAAGGRGVHDANVAALQAKAQRLAVLQAEDSAADRSSDAAAYVDQLVGLSTPPSPGRTGITVQKEGWLQKKTSTKPHRWQRRWFVVLTQQEEGLVTSRTLQYYNDPPDKPDVETAPVDFAEPRHAIPLYGDRMLERYDSVKFRLKLGTAGQILSDEKGSVAFQAETVHEATSWVAALTPGQEELGDLLLDSAQEGDRETILHALTAGADVDYRRGQGLSSLQWACIQGHTDCVLQLVTAGAEVVGRGACSVDGWTPIHAAAYGGHSEVLAPLIMHNADPNAIAADGRTAYELAEEQGHGDMMDELTQRYGAAQHLPQQAMVGAYLQRYGGQRYEEDEEDEDEEDEEERDEQDDREWQEGDLSPVSEDAESVDQSKQQPADGATPWDDSGLVEHRVLQDGSPEQDGGTLFLRKSGAGGARGAPHLSAARSWESPEVASAGSGGESLVPDTEGGGSLARMADALPDVAVDVGATRERADRALDL